jgi:hypothetical protein
VSLESQGPALDPDSAQVKEVLRVWKIPDDQKGNFRTWLNHVLAGGYHGR